MDPHRHIDAYDPPERDDPPTPDLLDLIEQIPVVRCPDGGYVSTRTHRCDRCTCGGFARYFPGAVATGVTTQPNQ